MVKLEEHLKEIKELQRQRDTTTSVYRRRDLQRKLNEMWAEYRLCRAYLKEAGRLP